MTKLGAQNIVWVPKQIIAAANITEFELPLYRPLGGPRSSLMHVNNDRATKAGLMLTDPAETIMNVKNWLASKDQTPALSAEQEAALIALFRQGL